MVEGIEGRMESLMQDRRRLCFRGLIVKAIRVDGKLAGTGNGTSNQFSALLALRALGLTVEGEVVEIEPIEGPPVPEARPAPVYEISGRPLVFGRSGKGAIQLFPDDLANSEMLIEQP